MPTDMVIYQIKTYDVILGMKWFGNYIHIWTAIFDEFGLDDIQNIEY